MFSRIVVSLFIIGLVFSVNLSIVKAETFDLDLDSWSEEELIDFIVELQSQIDKSQSTKGSRSSKKLDVTEYNVKIEIEPDTKDLDYLNSLSDEEQAIQALLIEMQKQLEEIARQIEILIMSLSESQTS